MHRRDGARRFEDAGPKAFHRLGDVGLVAFSSDGEGAQADELSFRRELLKLLQCRFDPVDRA
jgi:hypothetical protein